MEIAIRIVCGLVAACCLWSAWSDWTFYRDINFRKVAGSQSWVVLGMLVSDISLAVLLGVRAVAGTSEVYLVALFGFLVTKGYLAYRKVAAYADARERYALDLTRLTAAEITEHIRVAREELRMRSTQP